MLVDTEHDQGEFCDNAREYTAGDNAGDRIEPHQEAAELGSDIIRPLEQQEYQNRPRQSRRRVRELEAAPDCEP